MVKRTAMRRAGEPQDIANAIAFLRLRPCVVHHGSRPQRLRRDRALHLLSKSRDSPARPLGRLNCLYAEAGSRAVYLRRKRAARKRLVWQWSLVGLATLAIVTLVPGLGFAGSRKTLPDGATIAGVDVGGLKTRRRVTKLERRYEALKTTPVVFTAGPREWRFRPNEMILEVDWAAAVETARRQGDGFAPVRGLRRLGARFFGSDVTPRARVSTAVLAHSLGVLAGRIDRPERGAALRLRGLNPELVRGATGRKLDRQATARLIVSSLVSLERSPAALPVRITQPDVTAAELEPALAQVRTALSAPVRLALGPTRWRPRWRIAKMLELPRNGVTSLTIGGAGANEFFERFRKTVDKPAVDAEFVVCRATASPCGRASRGWSSTSPLQDGRSSQRRSRPRSESRASSCSAQSRAHDARGARDGNHGACRRLHHLLRRRAEPDPQRPARRRADRRRGDRARHDVLVQSDDRASARPTRASSKRR